MPFPTPGDLPDLGIKPKSPMSPTLPGRFFLFKDIRDTKGTFNAKMGSIKDRNGTDLAEVGEIKKRWQEYTELYRKDLHDPDNHKV